MITAERIAALHSQIAAARANDHMANNPCGPNGPSGPHAAGRAHAAEAMAWSEIEAYAAMSDDDLSALLGVEVVPNPVEGMAGTSYATIAELRTFRQGVLEVHGALRATARGTDPRG